MTTKRLYEVECKAYVWAEDASEAQDIVQREAGRNEEWEAWEASSVDAEWWDSFPYGYQRGDEELTCGQIMERQKGVLP